jgi:hypothetical protein
VAPFLGLDCFTLCETLAGQIRRTDSLPKENMNMSLMPDPTFYPSPGLAMQAAPERIAYVALLNVGKSGKRDA